jgi:hypothetical protein
MISIVSCTINLEIRRYIFNYFFAKEHRDCSVTQNKCSFLMRHVIFYLSIFSYLRSKSKGNAYSSIERYVFIKYIYLIIFLFSLVENFYLWCLTHLDGKRVHIDFILSVQIWWCTLLYYDSERWTNHTCIINISEDVVYLFLVFQRLSIIMILGWELNWYNIIWTK